MTRTPWPILAFVALLPLVGGCGGSSSTSGTDLSGFGGTDGSGPDSEATGPLLRWIPSEHDEAAVARSWADEGRWVESVTAVLEDKDPSSLRLVAHLDALDDPVRRPEVLREIVDLYEKAGHPGLAIALGAFPEDLARVIVVLSKDRPEWSMRVADRFLFVGVKKIPEAWSYPPLGTVVTKLCRRTDLAGADIPTGPARVWALKVAGKARVREAIPEILKAAGRKRSKGVFLAADPYGPAAAMARRIIAQNNARREAASKKRRK